MKRFLLAAFFSLFSRLALAAPATVATCDQTGIQSAITAAGVGGTVSFPSCTYIVDGLQNSVPNQTWVLEQNAVLQRSPTSTTAIITLQADGLKLRGGILDGARGVNPNAAVGIDGTGYSFDGRDFTMQNIPGWGVAIDNGQMFLSNVRFSNIFNSCIIWRNQIATTMHGPSIDRVLCDRSGENPSTVSAGGINIRAADGKWVIGTSVTNSEVLLPSSAAANNVAIEFWNSQHVHVIGNKISGSRIGISFGNVSGGLIAQNFVQIPVNYAVEIANASNSVNAMNNILTGYAPSLEGFEVSTGSSGIKIMGNFLNGFGTNVVIHSGCSATALNN
jgi:hypothetical protein